MSYLESVEFLRPAVSGSIISIGNSASVAFCGISLSIIHSKWHCRHSNKKWRGDRSTVHRYDALRRTADRVQYEIPAWVAAGGTCQGIGLAHRRCPHTDHATAFHIGGPIFGRSRLRYRFSPIQGSEINTDMDSITGHFVWNLLSGSGSEPSLECISSQQDLSFDVASAVACSSPWRFYPFLGAVSI